MLKHNLRNLSNVLLLLGVSAWCAVAAADDWPTWGGGSARNMVAGESRIAESFVPGQNKLGSLDIDLRTTRNVLWAATLGTQTLGNPTVAAGRVYLGTNDRDLGDHRYRPRGGGVLKCLEASSGLVLWQLVVPPFSSVDPEANFDDGRGICSSPAIDGDRVFVVTNRGEALCLDAKGMADGNHGPFMDEARFSAGGGMPMATGPRDADVLWRFDMVTELPCWPTETPCAAPLVHGEFVYVATGNGPRRPTAKAPYPAAPSLVVLEKRTGRLVGYDAERIGGRSLAAQASSPSLGEVGGRGLVFYGGGDGVCYAFEALSETPSRPAPLKKVWSFDCIPPSYRVASLKRIPYEEGDVRKQPGNANTGSYVGPSEIVATPVYEQKRVYVAIGRDPAQGRGRGALWCIDAARAGDVTRTARIWCYTDIERSVSTVSVVGGMVFAADVSGAVHCVDAKTGKRVWVFQTGGEIRGSTLAVDGRVCVGSGSALWALKAENPAQVAAKVELDGPVQGTPVAANGVLYVASQRHLWAVEEARARREEGPSEY